MDRDGVVHFLHVRALKSKQRQELDSENGFDASPSDVVTGHFACPCPLVEEEWIHARDTVDQSTRPSEASLYFRIQLSLPIVKGDLKSWGPPSPALAFLREAQVRHQEIWGAGVMPLPGKRVAISTRARHLVLFLVRSLYERQAVGRQGAHSNVEGGDPAPVSEHTNQSVIVDSYLEAGSVCSLEASLILGVHWSKRALEETPLLEVAAHYYDRDEQSATLDNGRDIPATIRKDQEDRRMLRNKVTVITTPFEARPRL
ncbi:hypothetical protein BDK51DRAFT_39590 [Blyttiomyces helicus]|uniref:Uncharacterized protein n=1 Tax=Blyttiomyces helicus TaxID=388810 RepID=A0A4P9WDW0_9FUNG|nr:hypothetical protein BDK51DRAFT_39590 [Blyttiomyces helicus]|eukprot:RKO88546.1 hypothetical protein BDK51DRAFT_39590 [Blyttiomyces helicus]